MDTMLLSSDPCPPSFLKDVTAFSNTAPADMNSSLFEHQDPNGHLYNYNPETCINSSQAHPVMAMSSQTPQHYPFSAIGGSTFEMTGNHVGKWTHEESLQHMESDMYHQLGAVPSMMPLVSVKEENSSAQLNVSIPRPVAPFCAAAVAAGDSFVESDQESFYEARVERLSRPVRDTSSPQNSEESECNDDLQKSECNDDKLDHLELLSIPLGSLDHTDPVINLDSVTNFFPHLDEVDHLWYNGPEIAIMDNAHQQPRQQDNLFGKPTKIKIEPKSPTGAPHQNDDDDDDAAGKLSVRRSTRKRIATKRERSLSEDEATGNSSQSFSSKERAGRSGQRSVTSSRTVSKPRGGAESPTKRSRPSNPDGSKSKSANGILAILLNELPNRRVPEKQSHELGAGSGHHLVEALEEISNMDQRALQSRFRLVYGITTTSNNNTWLRRKLLEAAGLKPLPPPVCKGRPIVHFIKEKWTVAREAERMVAVRG